MRHSAKDGTQLSPHCFVLLNPARNTPHNNRIIFVAGLCLLHSPHKGMVLAKSLKVRHQRSSQTKVLLWGRQRHSDTRLLGSGLVWVLSWQGRREWSGQDTRSPHDGFHLLTVTDFLLLNFCLYTFVSICRCCAPSILQPARHIKQYELGKSGKMASVLCFVLPLVQLCSLLWADRFTAADAAAQRMNAKALCDRSTCFINTGVRSEVLSCL